MEDDENPVLSSQNSEAEQPVEKGKSICSFVAKEPSETGEKETKNILPFASL